MKDNFIEFYVNKFNYLKSAEPIDISFLSPIIRRRLSKLDKGVISLLEKTICENTQNIVFSSQTGELERLLKIIEQYTTEKEVSPNTFSGSVHNYPVGFFLLNNKKSIPYNAISAGDNSISAGITAAVISKYNNVLFCYCDIYEETLYAFAISINKKDHNGKKYRFSIKNNNINSNFDDYIELFSEKKDILISDIFTIERITKNV